MMTDQYYIKKGRRYYPAERFDGFPADGIWLVTRANGGHSEQLMIKLEDDLLKNTTVQDVVSRVFTQHQIEEALAEAYSIIRSEKDSYSLMELAEKAAKILTEESNVV